MRRTAIGFIIGIVLGLALVPAYGAVQSASTGLRVTCSDSAHVPTVDPSGAVSCAPPGSSTTTTSTTTSTTTRPPATGCSTPTSAITGDRVAEWDAPISGTVHVDASWRSSRVGDYAVSVFGTTSGACWSGGRIIGEWGDADSWDDYHYRAGFRFSQPSMTVENLEVSGYGDALKPKDDGGGRATNWTIRGVYVAHAYDDCIENDYLHGGTLSDSLLNCYSGISTRASSGQGTTPDGPVLLDRVLLRLDPQPNVYKGTSPGHGGWFKLGKDTPNPTYTIRDSTFAAGQTPNHQDLGPPPVASCTRSSILWYGPGTFPETDAWRAACPDIQIVTGQQAVEEWVRRAVSWAAAHPGLVR